MKNKYMEMYYGDTTIKEHKKLHTEIATLVEELRQQIYDIGVSFQAVSRGLIKSKRIFYIEGKEYHDGYYKTTYDYGLGNFGFGSKQTRWGTNLDYDWLCLYNTKRDIIKKKKMLKDGIKRLYHNRFDMLIDTLKIFPDFDNNVKTYTEDFNLDDKEFWEDEPYKRGYAESELVKRYGSNVSITLIHKRRDNNNTLDIEPDDVEDMFLFNHLYDKLNIAMKEHIEKLTYIKKLLDDFIKTEDYKKVLQEAINIRLLEKI